MAREPSSAQIRDWCIGHIATMLDRRAAEIDPDAKFARLGLDSATIINLIIAAEEWLAIEVDPDAVYEHPSINALSGHLAALVRATLRGGSAA